MSLCLVKITDCGSLHYVNFSIILMLTVSGKKTNKQTNKQTNKLVGLSRL